MKLTKEDVKKYLKGKKVFCLNNEESEAIQRKLFEIGFVWGGDWRKEIHNDRWALFIHDNTITNSNQDIIYWESHSYKPISVEEIINLKLIEIPKFDPLTLQPFDKVLVRANDRCEWTIEFFEKYVHNDYYRFHCINCTWEQCIPYSEEVKHLIGTKNNPPEYYIIWK